MDGFLRRSIPVPVPDKGGCIMDEKKLYQRNQNWIILLVGFWLFATLEHSYLTLSQYSLHKTFNLFGSMIPYSDISAFLLVLALDLSMFWSISFLPFAKKRTIKLFSIYSLLAVSTIISIFLNVKYMILSSPSPSFGDLALGAVVGGLIPLFVVIFGYIQGAVLDSQIVKASQPDGAEHLAPVPDTEPVRFKPVLTPEPLPESDLWDKMVEKERGNEPTAQQVYKAKIDNPNASVRVLADQLKTSIPVIQKRINEIGKWKEEKNG